MFQHQLSGPSHAACAPLSLALPLTQPQSAPCWIYREHTAGWSSQIGYHLSVIARCISSYCQYILGGITHMLREVDYSVGLT